MSDGHPSEPPKGLAIGPASWELADEVTELYRTCEADRVGHATTTPQDVRYRWLALDDLETDALVVHEGTSVVAYVEFHEGRDPWSDSPDLFFDGRVHPAFTRRGIASYLFRLAEERGHRLVARSQTDHGVLRTMIEDLDEPARAFFTRRGFRPVRYQLQMRLALDRPVPPAEWPAGVSVRHPTAADDDAIWRLYELAFADHPEHTPIAREDFLHERLARDPHADRSLWWVAEKGEAIVGLCLARAGTPEHPGHGHIRDLAVHPDQQRQGIGMALLRTAFDAFLARDLVAADLEVDDVTMSGAVVLYERAGMHIFRRTEILEKQLAATQAG